MTEEEMAEEYASSATGDMGYYYEGLKEGFLTGLKAGRLEWHDLRKNPNDLPNDGEFVLANNILTTERVKFTKEKDGYCWRHDYFALCDVVKWCEVPM